MMRGYLDRMLRPREITLRFQKFPETPTAGATGVLTMTDRLSAHDLERIKTTLAGRQFVDGEVIKVRRQKTDR